MRNVCSHYLHFATTGNGLSQVTFLVVTGRQGVESAKNTLNTVHALDQLWQFRTVTDSHVVVPDDIFKSGQVLGVDEEEESRHHNHLLVETLVEEAKTVAELSR